jgi:phage terminase large subunit
VDPSALCCFFLDKEARTIYVYDELYKKQLTNPQLYVEIEKMGYRKERIIADAAEPKSISELRDLGVFNIRPARKGPDSIRHGIQLLQDYRTIIHPRCVNFITEISNYTWATDKNGHQTQQPIDEMNHLMDAWRYAAAILLEKEVFSFE